MSAFCATGISLSAWWVTPTTVFPPPPPCPLANIFCSPAHMVMTFSLKVCGTVTLRIHRTVTWMTTRWATHKSNQKRLVTENRANSHSCNALLFSSTCQLCVIWQSDLDGLSHGCLSCYDLWFMSNVSCTEKYLGYLRKVLLKQRTDLTLLKREICIIYFLPHCINAGGYKCMSRHIR